MAKAIIMPKFGFTQESAEIVRWLKHEGDQVDAGDPIAEVTTDKVNMEVEATTSGILAGVKYKEGAVVPVTEVIAYLLDPGENLPSDLTTGPVEVSGVLAETAGDKETAPDAPAAKPQGRIQATPVAEQLAREKGVSLADINGSGPGGRVTRGDVEEYWKASQDASGKVRATPAARRLASEMGVNLQQVSGTGPHGRIQGEDVRKWTSNLQSAAKAAVPEEIMPPAQTKPGEIEQKEVKKIPMSTIRKLIAERTQRSAQEAPHIYFEADVDAGPLEALRKRGNNKLTEGQAKISLTALLVRASAWALLRHPMLNSQLQDDSILLLPEMNIGVAVAAESGLIVPVVRDAAQKSVTQIAQELEVLVEKARLNRLRPDDVSNGTFTISNLGMFGVDRFTAIINPPQAAILAVGRIRKVFVPDENDQPLVCNQMTMTLGADHRIVDGAMAARFLADLREVLEYPDMLAL